MNTIGPIGGSGKYRSHVVLVLGENMFNVQSLVAYPAQGVGVIERIDHKMIGGATCEFYTVRIRANNIILMVPVQNATSVGLRSLCSPAEAQGIMELLRTNIDEAVTIGQNWNRRFREYTERLKGRELAQVSTVLRELLLIGRVKELSFGERRLLEQAMVLVVGELSEVLGVTESSLREELLTLYAPPPLEVEA